MPEFEVKRPVQKKKKKKENIFVAIYKGLIPCKGDTKNDIIRKIVFIVALVILVYAVITMLYYFFFKDNQMNEERAYLDSLINQNHTDDVISVDLGGNDDSNEENKTVNILKDYEALYEENHDMVGFLRVGTLLGEGFPVTQYTDNDYYLKHSFLGYESVYGNPFVDYEQQITPELLPGNVIIYGHNTNKDKNMFNPLSYYVDGQHDGFELLKSTYKIDFDTIYDRGEYLIFAIFVANTLEDHGEVFRYQDVVNFSNKSEFDSYVSECLDRSLYYTGVDVTYGDQLLTLSTCNFSWTDARTVIVARKVRSGESPLLDSESFIDNSGFDDNGNVKRKMFEAYYEGWNCEWGGRNWDPSYLH